MTAPNDMSTVSVDMTSATTRTDLANNNHSTRDTPRRGMLATLLAPRAAAASQPLSPAASAAIPPDLMPPAAALHAPDFVKRATARHDTAAALAGVHSPLYIADADLRNTVAGGLAGVIAAILVCPLDVLKLRIQSQNAPRGETPKYAGTFSGVALIAREEGLRGLFRGLSITCLAYISDRAIWFGCYHRFGDLIRSRLDERHKRRLQTNPDATSYPHYIVPLASTVCASLICMSVTNPLWVVRSRWMIQPSCPAVTSAHAPLQSVERYTSIPDVFRRMYLTEGFRSFYNGYLPSLFGICHVAVQFPLYEWMKMVMSTQNEPSQTSNGGYVSMMDQEQNLSSMQILFASALSKMVASVLTYPHEVIRTRMQIQHVTGRRRHPIASWSLGESIAETPTQPQRMGVVAIFKKILREEGKLGFYKGLTTNLIRTVPASALSLWGFEELRKEMAR